MFMQLERHDRCKTTVEPLVKQQWFVKMDEMAKPAIAALKEGRLKFVPENYGRHICIGWRESVTGVFQDSSGGDTESRLITAMSAVRWLYQRMHRHAVRSADVHI